MCAGVLFTSIEFFLLTIISHSDDVELELPAKRYRNLGSPLFYIGFLRRSNDPDQCSSFAHRFQNYCITSYVAELVNSLTNLLFLYLAYLGVRNCFDNGHGAVHFLSYVGYAMVGIGSLLFHTTLKCKWSWKFMAESDAHRSSTTV